MVAVEAMGEAGRVLVVVLTAEDEAGLSDGGGRGFQAREPIGPFSEIVVCLARHDAVAVLRDAGFEVGDDVAAWLQVMCHGSNSGSRSH